MAPSPLPKIVLFGYDSSPFTQKIRLALAHRQIPYTFVLVPSMMPRPVLLENFNLTYRKIPVLAINKDIYIDTSLILETLAAHPAFPISKQHPALYPDDRTRTLTRLLSSHYTDRPLFRLATGLIPVTVWQSSFGDDRAGLIGHKLDANKLGAKVPRNISGLDTFLSILEPFFAAASSSSQSWFLGTETPSAADIALFYQLDWGEKISRGDLVRDLTGGSANDGNGEGITSIFNRDRYPGLLAWFERTKRYFATLPSVETRIERNASHQLNELMSQLNASSSSDTKTPKIPILHTAAPWNQDLDDRIGLRLGARVSVAPDDTGRDDPTLGTLVALSPEEVVIVPDLIDGKESNVRDIRVHFPRVGFVIKNVGDGDQHVKGRVSAKAKL